jgi:hypothetical protein
MQKEACRYKEEPGKTSDRRFGVPNNILTENLPNTRKKCYYIN